MSALTRDETDAPPYTKKTKGKASCLPGYGKRRGLGVDSIGKN